MLGYWGYISPVTCAESVPWHAARWPHWGAILRSGELGMMDLELTRWKHVGLFYKQLKSSPQTAFLNSVSFVELLGLGASWLHREREQRRQLSLSGAYYGQVRSRGFGTTPPTWQYCPGKMAL